MNSFFGSIMLIASFFALTGCSPKEVPIRTANPVDHSDFKTQTVSIGSEVFTASIPVGFSEKHSSPSLVVFRNDSEGNKRRYFDFTTVTFELIAKNTLTDSGELRYIINGDNNSIETFGGYDVYNDGRVFGWRSCGSVILDSNLAVGLEYKHSDTSQLEKREDEAVYMLESLREP